MWCDAFKEGGEPGFLADKSMANLLSSKRIIYCNKRKPFFLFSVVNHSAFFFFFLVFPFVFIAIFGLAFRLVWFVICATIILPVRESHPCSFHNGMAFQGPDMFSYILTFLTEPVYHANLSTIQRRPVDPQSQQPFYQASHCPAPSHATLPVSVSVNSGGFCPVSFTLSIRVCFSVWIICRQPAILVPRRP